MQLDRPPQGVFQLEFGQEASPCVGQLPASHYVWCVDGKFAECLDCVAEKKSVDFLHHRSATSIEPREQLTPNFRWELLEQPVQGPEPRIHESMMTPLLVLGSGVKDQASRLGKSLGPQSNLMADHRLLTAEKSWKG
jgi:hypothetical protein